MWWSRAGSPPTAWFCHSWRTTESRSSAEDAWSSARRRWHPENTNHFEKLAQRVLTLAEVSGENMTQQSIEFKLRTNHCFAMPFSSNVVKNVKVSQDCCVSSSSLFSLTHLDLEVLNLLQVVLFCVLLFVFILLRVVAGHFIWCWLSKCLKMIARLVLKGLSFCHLNQLQIRFLISLTVTVPELRWK